MSLIDDIKRDREAGTGGPWSLEVCSRKHEDWPEIWIKAQDATPCTGHHSFAELRYGCDEAKEAGDLYANARRIARVPDLEAALLAAEELAEKLGEALFILECDDPERPIVREAKTAITAYREALK